jgi:8-oxo-dGTP pyrophosphatase MutT (NUDIX family)
MEGINMSEHFKALSAIFPLIIRDNGSSKEILLHRRQNTGYQDGKWDIAGSGHVDKDETARAAVVRECWEELGITVEPEDLVFAHLSHRISKDRTYYDIYFFVTAYSGSPSIMEPEKCSELKWFGIQDLPEDIIECRKQDINNSCEKSPYSEKTES